MKKRLYHCAMNNTNNNNTMKTIEQQLTKEFATFKVEYLKRVEDWTIETQKYFQGIQNEYNQLQYCKNPKRVSKREFSSIFGYYTSTTKDFSEMSEEEVEIWNRKETCLSILRDCKIPFGWATEKLVQAQVEAASNWFDGSIVKLAVKIENKGINSNEMTISSSYIDRNLCTIISDGDKKVKAQTIFANGEIKRPHFRYLIK